MIFTIIGREASALFGVVWLRRETKDDATLQEQVYSLQRLTVEKKISEGGRSLPFNINKITGENVFFSPVIPLKKCKILTIRQKLDRLPKLINW